MHVRVVNVDFYMHPPIPNLDPFYSEFRGSATHQVPVLRIFGSTDTGIKTCLHVHGVFPYIYIPYDGQEGVDSFMYQLAANLDKAINVSLGQTSSNVQHIFKITLVSGIPFYGYHAKHHQFLKLYFYNPLILKKACALLQNGSIMGKIFQPHEAHIPYVLQFMIDYNLYGMSFAKLSEVKYRNNSDLTDIPEELILPSTIQKMSTCKLEVDALAENILNRLEVNSQSLGLNPGIQALWDDEKQRRRDVGDASLVEHCLTQNRVDVEPTATHLAYLNALKEKLQKTPKNEEIDSQNLSVYPAETPKDSTKKILNASTIESHIEGSQSSDSTFLDFTLTPEEDEANVSLDREAMELLEILGNLRNDIETDSILSQALPEQDSDGEEKEEDLSVPLPYIKTPTKGDQSILDQNEEDLDECYFDLSINIPQLDGFDDLPEKKRRKKKLIELHSGAGGRTSNKEESPQVNQESSISNNNLTLNQSTMNEFVHKLNTDIQGMLENPSKKESISTITDLKNDLLNLVSKAQENQAQNNDVFKTLFTTESVEKDRINFDEFYVRRRRRRRINRRPSSSSTEIVLSENEFENENDEVESHTSKSESKISTLNEVDLSSESQNKHILPQSDLNIFNKTFDNNLHINLLKNNKLPQLKVKLCDIFYKHKNSIPQNVSMSDFQLNVSELEHESSRSEKNENKENSIIFLSDTKNPDKKLEIDQNLSINIENDNERFDLSNIEGVKKRRGRRPKNRKKSLSFKFKLKPIIKTTSLDSFESNQNFISINSETEIESDLFITSESTIMDNSEINKDLSGSIKKLKAKSSFLEFQECSSTPNSKSPEGFVSKDADYLENVKTPKLKKYMDKIIDLDDNPIFEIKDQHSKDYSIINMENDDFLNFGYQKIGGNNSKDEESPCFESKLSSTIIDLESFEAKENLLENQVEEIIDLEEINYDTMIVDEDIDGKENESKLVKEKEIDVNLNSLISIVSLESDLDLSTNIDKSETTNLTNFKSIKSRKRNKRRGRKSKKKVSINSNQHCSSIYENTMTVVDSNLKSKRDRKRKNEKTPFKSKSNPIEYLTRGRAAKRNLNNSIFITDQSLNESQNVTNKMETKIGKENSVDRCVQNIRINTVVNDVEISDANVEIFENTSCVHENNPQLSEINENSILEISSSDNDSTMITNDNKTEMITDDNNLRNNVGLSMPMLENSVPKTIHKKHEEEISQFNPSKSSSSSKEKMKEIQNNIMKEIDIFREEDRCLRDYDKKKTIIRNKKRTERLKSDTSRNENLLKRKLIDEIDQEKIQSYKNTPTTKKTIPITVHVPLLEDSFCKSPTNPNKNKHGFTYTMGLYSSPKFKVVQSDNRPYSYLPKTKKISTSQYQKKKKFPNTKWKESFDTIQKYPAQKQIIMHSCTVLDESQKIDINTLPLKNSYNLNQTSVFPVKNPSTSSGSYSMNDFSDFQRLVLEEFENCYEENTNVNVENEITFKETMLNDHISNEVVDVNEEIKIMEKLRDEVEKEKMEINDNDKIKSNEDIFTQNTEKEMKVFKENEEERKNRNKECSKFTTQEEICDEVKNVEVLKQIAGSIDEMIKSIDNATKATNQTLENNQQPVKLKREKLHINNINKDNIEVNKNETWKRIKIDSEKTNIKNNIKTNTVIKSPCKKLINQEIFNNHLKKDEEKNFSIEIVLKPNRSPNEKITSLQKKDCNPNQESGKQKKIHKQIHTNNDVNKNISVKNLLNKNVLNPVRSCTLPTVNKKKIIKPLETPNNVDVFQYIKQESKICSQNKKGHCPIEKKLFGFDTGKDIDEREHFPRFQNYLNGRGNIKQNVSCDRKTDTTKYPVNQYAYLDGTNDSSSSDEDVITTVKKTSRPIASQPTSKYQPLKVKYTSPIKSAGKSAASRIQSQDKNSNVKALTQTTLSTTASKKYSQNHRRKLSFSQVTTNKLNKTQIEEQVSCRFKPQRNLKHVTEKIYIDCDSNTSTNSVESDKEILPFQVCQTNLGQDEYLENDLNEIIEKTDGIISNCTKKKIDSTETENNKKNQSDEEFNLDKTLTPKNNNSNLNDSSFSDDLFSPASDEITICHKIDPAEQYDVEKRFIPLAGSSKMDPQFQKLSQHSNNSSSNDFITPYQKEQNISIENVIESVVSNNYELSDISEENVKINETISSLHINTDSANEIISGKFEKLDTSILSVYEPISQNLNETNKKSLIITPKFNPPSKEMIENSLKTYDIPEVRQQEPFYSDRNDVTGNVEIGRKVLKIPSNNVVDLPSFKTNFEGIESHKKKILEVLEVDNKKLSSKEILEYKLSTSKNCNVVITPGKLPPSRKEVEEWLKEKKIKKEVEEGKLKEKKKIFLINSPGRDGEESFDSLSLSPCTPIDANSTIFKIDDNNLSNGDQSSNTQNSFKTLPNSGSLKSDDSLFQKLSTNTNSHEITGPSHNNTNNFLVASHNLNEAKAVKENLNLTILSLEVVVITRNEYKPNPELDQIKAIIFTLYDNENISKGGFIIDSLPTSPTKIKLSILKGIDSKYNMKPVNTEMELINEFLEFVKIKDPDIFVGFEIEMLSWGYLIERGYVLGLNLTISLSRTPEITRKKRDDEELTITGRILIDFWRLLRHEIALTSYSFENIVYHILHRRIPLYSHKDLTDWLQHPTSVYRNRVIEYYLFKTRAVLQIMDQLDLIGRTSELAKLFGIQFYEVLSRGSQFRVESMMLRLAKPLNFIPVSPNQQQRARMRAPESLPLIMEPESKFYTDPVIVLDFQSLYPSMIIAYNYCFSTCLGRIEHLGSSSPFEFGTTQLKVSRKYLKYFLNKEKLNISPCGIAYVNKSIRLGILPRMLQEILDTRLMVKKSLKQNAGNKVLSKVLDARQLGLKLIANVTYGYTAANFSGRMPCIELGDSVVSKGRETLQRAINLVEKTPKWGARVVYGDTDSLFVLIPGKSKEIAFKIGAEIAEAVTNANPSPVKLKLEKIFQPCILQTKKRYVGYMYESVDQKEPEFLAKGIETVRRDGCPASAKMLEKCLKLLFETRDVSLIKKYVLRQFGKLLSGRVSIQDLTFAKEYRGASHYRPGACVPALELAKKWTSIDKRNEPRKGERVPYVIINGPPGQPLIKLVKSPRDLLNDSSLRINALYYITKAIIPPLNRCFLLIGADLNQWFNEMPRKQFKYLPTTSSPSKDKTKKNTITQFFSILDCAICGTLTQEGLCGKCKNKPQESGLLLHEKVRLWEQNFFNALQICRSCCGRQDEISCISLDCPVYYRRIQTNRDLQQSGFIRQLITTLPSLEF